MGDAKSSKTTQTPKSRVMLKVLLQDYKQFYVEDLADLEYTYEKFAEKCVDTIDSFGLGFTLMYWLENAGKFLNDELQQELFICFSYMITPRQTIRYTIEQSIARFENILEQHGLLEKYKKKIVDHVLLDKDAKVAKKDEPIVVHLPKNIKIDPKLADLDPSECPDGKEMNPKTKRCVKKCGNGYSRNAAFRCVKIKTTKTPSKRCPKGTRKNPKTGKCEKKQI